MDAMLSFHVENGCGPAGVGCCKQDKTKFISIKSGREGCVAANFGLMSFLLGIETADQFLAWNRNG